jgi:hypothetical protein
MHPCALQLKNLAISRSHMAKQLDPTPEPELTVNRSCDILICDSLERRGDSDEISEPNELHLIRIIASLRLFLFEVPGNVENHRLDCGWASAKRTWIVTS